jgi:hypothetical protein
MTNFLTLHEIANIEKKNVGKSPTQNNLFDQNGFFFIKNICSENLVPDIILEKNIQGIRHHEESEIIFSSSHEKFHENFRDKLEEITGVKLKKTFCYERIYREGQKMSPVLEHDDCEFSLIVFLGSNCPNPWRFYVKTPNFYGHKPPDHPDADPMTIIKPGEIRNIFFDVGDGLLLKACEIPHWRNTLEKKNKINLLNLFSKKEDIFYREVVFNYIISDGNYDSILG